MRVKDMFEEIYDEQGATLHIKTRGGLVKVGERLSPEEEAREYRFASRIGLIFAIIVFSLFFRYLLSDLNNVIVDSNTKLPILWETLPTWEKALIVFGQGLWASILAILVWVIVSVGVSFYRTMRKMDHKKVWEALRQAQK